MVTIRACFIGADDACRDNRVTDTVISTSHPGPQSSSFLPCLLLCTDLAIAPWYSFCTPYLTYFTHDSMPESQSFTSSFFRHSVTRDTLLNCYYQQQYSPYRYSFYVFSLATPSPLWDRGGQRDEKPRILLRLDSCATLWDSIELLTSSFSASSTWNALKWPTWRTQYWPIVSGAEYFG